MDELISRQAAIDAVNSRKTAEQCKEGDVRNWTVDACVDMIKQLPSAQPEIIRCKECKYARLTNDGSCKYCDIWFPDEAEYMDGDYYCASAERKSNG